MFDTKSSRNSVKSWNGTRPPVKPLLSRNSSRSAVQPRIGSRGPDRWLFELSGHTGAGGAPHRSDGGVRFRNQECVVGDGTQVQLLQLWESKQQIYVYHNGVASLSAIFDGEDNDNARWYDGDDVSFAKYTEHPLFRDPEQLHALLRQRRPKLGAMHQDIICKTFEMSHKKNPG